MGKFERHFFVCVTERPPTGKPSCTHRGAPEVYAALQEGLGANPDLWGRVVVTSCGCLGPCFDGPNVVVYPEGIWYAAVTEEDAREIVEKHMVGGVAVERLFYQWPEDD